MGSRSQEQEGDEAGGTRASPSSDSELPNWLKSPDGTHPCKYSTTGIKEASAQDLTGTVRAQDIH